MAAAMVVAGIAGGGLVAWFTGDRFLNSEVSQPVIVLQSTLLTVVVAIALWRTRKRGWRAFAAGLTTCWALVVLAVGLVWALSEDEPPGLADNAGTPGYYLGEEVDGLPVNQTRPVGEIEATGVGVGYGQPCSGDSETCEWDVFVSTFSMNRDYVEKGGCERLAPVMGVPAVRYGISGLLLFTGQVMIHIADNRRDGLGDELPLAKELRPLDKDQALTSLPPPSPETRAFVDDTCGREE